MNDPIVTTSPQDSKPDSLNNQPHNPDALPEFDVPNAYLKLFDVPKQPEYEVDKAVFILNDWSSGQFHVFNKPDDMNLMYFYRLAGWVGVAEKYGYDRLDDNGRYVASELRHRLLKAIQKLTDKTQPPRRTKRTNVSPKKIPGYVYLLQSPTSAYKIGRTRNPENRLKTFSVRLPFEVEFVCLIKTDDMHTLEQQLHDKFAKKRINGEWFALTPDDVIDIRAMAK